LIVCVPNREQTEENTDAMTFLQYTNAVGTPTYLRTSAS
jgi:hypothetical protein